MHSFLFAYLTLNTLTSLQRLERQTLAAVSEYHPLSHSPWGTGTSPDSLEEGEVGEGKEGGEKAGVRERKPRAIKENE